MSRILFYVLGIILGTSIVVTRSILLTGICMFLGALYLLFFGVIMLRKKWYARFLIFSNKISGIESDINPLVFKGRLLGAIIYLLLGIFLLFIAFMLIMVSTIRKTF